MIRHLDLFSGMGGFAIAVHMLGGTTVGFCDNDKASQELLQLRWPGVPIYDDIRTLKGTDVGPVDLVTGGFPCQPFSVAGNQRGAADDRHLWPEMVRVIAECRPRYVLGENVTGIIKMELDNCISDLERIGYSARAIVVPAIGTDARHIRQRIWLMAHDDRYRFNDDGEREEGAERPPLDTTQSLIEQRQNPPQQLDRLAVARGRNGSEHMADTDAERELQPQGGERNERRRAGDAGEDVPDTDRAGQQEQRRPESGGEELSASEQHCRWPVEPSICRVADGVPRRVDRLRMLGNGIVPAVAYEILRVMLADTESKE